MNLGANLALMQKIKDQLKKIVRVLFNILVHPSMQFLKITGKNLDINDPHILCLCGHLKYTHMGNISCASLVKLAPDWFTSCQCSKFTLDNLSYIEDLAKEKGLI
jgi:hypothetical protein